MTETLFLRISLIANLAATLMLVGLIWLIQIVHYPLFADVGEREFARYEKKHSNKISVLVGPLMLIELASAIALAFISKGWAVWTGLALVAVIWSSTAAIQIPCHSRLASGFDACIHRKLVQSNWIRTIAWTLRGWIALLLVWPTTSH